MQSAADPGTDPVILMVAPNGARKTRADHPALPIGPEALAREAEACVAAGACMMHLHVRDDADGHSLDPGRYREALDAIHDAVGAAMIAQITTEAVGRFGPEEQMACVRAVVPESASVAVRELAPDTASEDAARDFFGWMEQAGVIAQYILYAPDDVRRFHDLRRRGVIPGARPFVLLVLGRYTAGQRSNPRDLLPLLSALDAADGLPCTWSVCAFGDRETACALTAVGLGGHSRIGFENNTNLPDGRVARNNAELVAATRDGVLLMGRAIADASVARQLLSAA